jgi:hypothetical protein
MISHVISRPCGFAMDRSLRPGTPARYYESGGKKFRLGFDEDVVEGPAAEGQPVRDFASALEERFFV